MAQIIWRRAAADALEEINDYISRDSADDARRVVSEIMTAVERAADTPESGSIVLEYNDPNIRERLACRFRIIYRVQRERDAIEIVLLRRQTRRLPKSIP